MLQFFVSFGCLIIVVYISCMYIVRFCFHIYRCSLSFFNEEREVLHARRTKIRLLQQQKHVNLCNIKDLPEEIPLHLVIGTEVTGELWCSSYLAFMLHTVSIN